MANPRLGSDVLFLSAQRCHVKKVVGVKWQIETPLISGVRVKDLVASAYKDTQAWQFTLIGPELLRLHEVRCVRIVVLDTAYIFVQRHMEVVIEIGREGREPEKCPSHALFEGSDL